MPKLIDTNVLIAASASNPLSDLASTASPADPELRKKVLDDLLAFADSGDQIVLDLEGHIRSEYGNKMGYSTALRDQHYGIQLLQELDQTSRINYVTIEYDEFEGGASIEPELHPIVSDKADRKWIASAVSHRELYDGVVPPIVYAAESDWYFIESELGERGFLFERLLPKDWYKSLRKS
jgi:hypothetical protein